MNKVALSTSLAQVAGTKERVLLSQSQNFAKVFNEPLAGVLPPQRLFDHVIDINDTFVPKVTKAYSPNPKEMDACKEFIADHQSLAKSKSLNLLKLPPSFLFRKRQRSCPCHDYQYLNEYMVKNTYPLPLISTLINKLEGARFFSKMDI